MKRLIDDAIAGDVNSLYKALSEAERKGDKDMILDLVQIAQGQLVTWQTARDAAASRLCSLCRGTGKRQRMRGVSGFRARGSASHQCTRCDGSGLEVRG